jgi:hypothetical protein
MTISEIVELARAAVRRAKGRLQSEGSAVEFKREWPDDDRKAARQIGALANASRGHPAIWVIGVDEEAGQLFDVDRAELANWWPAVSKHFDSIAPEMVCDVPFDVDGKTLVALGFDTSDAPFVVKCQNSGAVEREVPWREGTKTKSATRAQLLSLLAPQVVLPKLDVLEGTLFRGPDRGVANQHVLAARLVIYVASSEKLHAPHHRRTVTARFPDSAYPEVHLDWFGPLRRGDSSQVQDDDTQLTIAGSGTFILECSGISPFSHTVPEDVEVELRLEFNEARGLPQVVQAYFGKPEVRNDGIEEIGRRTVFRQVFWSLRKD